MAGKPGLEPRLTESESVVLPIKLFPNGAGRRNRTLDLMLTRQLLYRLSYTSINLNTQELNNSEPDRLHQIAGQTNHKDQHTLHSSQKLQQEH